MTNTPVGGAIERITRLAGSHPARPARFAVVGAVTFALQLVLLSLLTGAGVESLFAYVIALALAVQFNFGASQLLVWHDRDLSSATSHLARRWLTFHGAIALSLVVNVVAFALAERALPDVAAAIVALAASTVLKFLSLDRLVFRAGGLR